jgi:hypothetical protein
VVTEFPTRRTHNRALSTFLLGSDLSTWRRLLRENHRAVDAEFLPRAGLITAASLHNSVAQALEERRFGAALATTSVPSPLIVLGHWRSGLARVQHLLALDDGFTFPNLHQVRHPRTFLSTERAHTRLTGWMLPTRHPGDGLPLGHASPEDDEYALANLTGSSPYIAGLFPRRRAHYVSAYLTLRGAAAREVAAWKGALHEFARKLTWRYGRPLILRSPVHTGRLRHLLDLFPDARIIHVHRHPYAVFEATCRSTAAAQVYNRLHRAPAHDVSALVLERYTRLYDAFFEDRHLVRPGRLHEVRFEDVMRDPVGTLRRVYAALTLPAFDRVRPRLQEAVGQEAGPGVEAVPEPEPSLRARVAAAWRRNFETWSDPA